LQPIGAAINRYRRLESREKRKKERPTAKKMKYELIKVVFQIVILCWKRQPIEALCGAGLSCFQERAK